MRLLRRSAAVAMLVLGASPLYAQTQREGQVARSAVGKVGERQTRDEPVEGIEPMARLDSRIQNRVQSRIRNRIDRNYDPQANVTSPFAVAQDQTRSATRRRR